MGNRNTPDPRTCIEYADRYGSTTPCDPATMCLGECEGTGWVPIAAEDYEEPWRTLWLEAERKEHAPDGWHFVKCPDCGGTGKRPEAKS